MSKDLTGFKNLSGLLFKRLMQKPNQEAVIERLRNLEKFLDTLAMQDVTYSST